jgi:Zeta toxin
VGRRGGAPFRDEGSGLSINSADEVRAAAETYALLCRSRREPAGRFYPVLMAAARFHDMLDHPAVLTAARWQEWLHPRGMDGRFIEKFSMVDIFSKDGDQSTLNDPKAQRRRAKIMELTPQGANVQYYDQGKPIAADPKGGYPSLISLADIPKRISSAPNSRARLEGVSSKAEFDEKHRPAMSQDDYDHEIDLFNERIIEELDPGRSAADRGTEPVTDDEYDKHVSYVTDVTDLGLGKQPTEKGMGLASDAAFKDNYGRWSQEQLENMLLLSDELFGAVTAGKPKDRKAILLGGLPGAGKSSLLAQMHQEGSFDENDWVQINPDLVKDEMIKRDWYPKIEGLTPNETAGFIHAQSSEIATMLERMAMKDGYNLIFDTTMGGIDSDGKSWTDYTLQSLAINGYQGKDIDGIFIDSGTDHSLGSIAFRHKDGLNKYRTGVSRNGRGDSEIKNGGRFVPNKVVQAMTSGDNGPSANVQTFDRIKGKFARWAKYNVGNEPGTKPNPELVESTPDMPGQFQGALV